jgi:NAD(P)-dependent dehydrogenase (short-subunit alcohol dehydrogenase family)
MQKLAGKVALITGAASGIGAATARRFVADGANVIIADIDESGGKKICEELGEATYFVRTDVTIEADIKNAVDTAVTHFGRLDCLFNNAGSSTGLSSIEDVSIESWDRAMAILVRSVFLGIKHAAPVMKRQKSGTIINTASIAGHRDGYGPLVYNVCKAAVIRLTQSSAAELGEHFVRVNSVSPGCIVTPMVGKAVTGWAKEEVEERLPIQAQAYAQMQPIPRAGQPEDIAAAVAFLASEGSSFINGQDLIIDGGCVNGLSFSRTAAQMGQLASIFQTT